MELQRQILFQCKIQKTGSEEHGIVCNNDVAASFLAIGGMKLDRMMMWQEGVLGL